MFRARGLTGVILLLVAIRLGTAQASSTTDTFTVSAVITSGCALGTSTTSETTDLGTLSFGTMANLANHVDATSASGAGFIVVTCTPGTAVTISLDYGVNGGSDTERYLSNGLELLGYQLYQDAAHSTVWEVVPWHTVSVHFLRPRKLIPSMAVFFQAVLSLPQGLTQTPSQ